MGSSWTTSANDTLRVLLDFFTPLSFVSVFLWSALGIAGAVAALTGVFRADIILSYSTVVAGLCAYGTCKTNSWRALGVFVDLIFGAVATSADGLALDDLTGLLYLFAQLNVSFRSKPS
ncbi:uncharacterized protein TERG_12497 [Trichophyton rubrum CBS 118892]|uniref:Uncharacterized protein n=1 Tax=Trichophyton rubrum (strain ATCC MYA-4607 / CBS 118892) TaxID=559305 RepID=A0A080WWU1_TRIRC|nr:uncharacterized protein TERG_12497 [Trichophyton rubrum CBS 118892]KFL62543.1 hypothetical protein TERG_12497 [Trichophyton rubrum CBS 118892]